MLNINKQLEIIRCGTEEIISEEELAEKLKERRPLIIKAGFDPSAPDVHLGHTVLLRKLKQFQDMGHRIVFLVGDFTAMIGDPSGVSVTRKPLSRQEVLRNARTYQEQAFKVLSPEKTEVVFNSQWLNRLSFSKIAKLAAVMTVAQILERDDFSLRIKEKRPIRVLELFYPLLQGYDSVVLKADVELGGTDQKFNLLIGRDLQREYKFIPQVIITMPLLEGVDGENKMSKSLGNHIGICEPPNEMFGKLMSIPDSLIIKYCKLLTDFSLDRIKEMESAMKDGHLNPRDAKEELAFNIVSTYHSPAEAEKACGEFRRVFSKRCLPSDISEFEIDKIRLKKGKIWIVDLLTLLGFAKTNNEARRLVIQGGVKSDGLAIRNPDEAIEVIDGMILQVGRRRFVKLVLRL